MLKAFDELLPKLDELSVEIDLIKDNLLAIETAYSDNMNDIPCNSLTIPCMLLNEKCQKLDALNDAFHKAIREVRING